MKKITRKNLDELRELMPVISEIEQKEYIGGGNGSYNDPYTPDQYDFLCELGVWNGGYVEGWGYTFPEVVVTGNYGGSGSNSGYYPDGGSGYWEDYGGSGNYGSSGYYGDSGNYGSSGNYGYGSSNDGLNTNYFTFNTQGWSVFKNQLTKILQSNSVIAGLLRYFEQGIVHLTFGVQGLPQGNTGNTTFMSQESYHINFNANMPNIRRCLKRLHDKMKTDPNTLLNG